MPSQYLSLGSLLVVAPVSARVITQPSSGTKIREPGVRHSFGGGDFLLSPAGSCSFPAFSTTSNSPTALVGHSLVAVAGFLTALLAVVLVQILGDDGWILTRRWSFYMWNWSVFAYVVLMFIAGWIEGSDPAFTDVPGPTRNILYSLRLVTGILMLISSAEWLMASSALLRASRTIASKCPHEVAA